MHPQTLALVKTRAEALDLEVDIGPISNANLGGREYAGILIQYPDTYGKVKDFEDIATMARKNGVSVIILSENHNDVHDWYHFGCVL